MAWVSLSDALEMALKRLEIDCAATAGTVDADAEKMAAALGKQQPPSQGRLNNEGTKGIGKTGADASRGHTPPAPPISGTKFTDIPNAHAPARSVNLVLVIDNERLSGLGIEVPVCFALRTGKRGGTPNPLVSRQNGSGSRTDAHHSSLP